MFTRQYEIIADSPSTIGWDTYAQESYVEYQNLLMKFGNDEKVFQSFFEKNPSFVPGAFELIGKSGHYPFTQSLIAEPELDNGLFRRRPDFIWLAQNSTYFSPVLIEIEKPDKKLFIGSGIQSAEFSQALNQIAEWKAILSEPENILMFYKCFCIPDWMRQKTFAPQYGLIYGRRSEFEDNPQLVKMRAQLVPKDVVLMSYDRLSPIGDYHDLLCCKLKQGKYNVITIPPTYRYGPANSENLSTVNGFDKAIFRMEKTTQERKDFLFSRYDYWKEYGKQEKKGVMSPSDSE